MGGGGGGSKNFFSDLEICMLRFPRGVRGHAFTRKFFKMVQFSAYLDPILSLKFFEKYLFYMKNKYFRYTLAIGCYSWRN